MTHTRPTISTEAWNNMTEYEQDFFLNWEGYMTTVAQDLYTYDPTQDRPIKVRPFPQGMKEQGQ